MNSKEITNNFLNLYWARPEVVVWRVLDVLQMQEIDFKKPALDLGCGDGTFMFTLLGGKTDSNFDVYKTISNTNKFWKNNDIHNQKSDYKPKILRKTNRTVNYGLDLKFNLLDKAKKLNFYKKLIQHDLNKPIPMESSSLNSIFSNVFYWIDNLEFLIKECHRILKPGGKLIVCVPNNLFKKNLIFNQYLMKKQEWAKELDRGIYANISKHCYSFSKWKSLFSKVGFKVENHSNYLSEDLIKFWSIGFRPYSPYFIEMANSLDSKTRKKIKEKLVKEIVPIIDSYVNYELSSNKKKCFHLLVLKK